ncbi:MAG: GldG family protein [Verrucomicrobia bacterium]|nr:GldG family protein [Verrucomicrobiota bacterium]
MNADTPTFSFGRRWNVLLNVVLSIFAVLALAVMANYLAVRHFKRLHWTADTQMKLSPRTLQVLAMLTNKVHVTVYYDSQDDPYLYGRITGLLREYQSASPHLEVQRVDYFRDPAAAKEVKARHRLNQVSDKNLVIFECNGNRDIVTSLELSDTDIQGVLERRTREVKRTHFRGELRFTSAIYNVVTPRRNKAYFLRGHGEHNPESTDQTIGCSELVATLKDECSMLSDTLTLVGTNEVPADCNLLIIPGPMDPFSKQDLDKLQRYLDQGGRMLVLFNYFSVRPGKPSGLERFLAQYNVAVGENLVTDTWNTVSGSGDLRPVELGSHPIVARMQNSVLHLNLPRSIRRLQSAAARAGASRVDELLFTGPYSRVDSSFRNGVPQKSEPASAVPLMVAVERGSVPGVSAERGVMRLVVLGDSWLMQNQGIQSMANRDFAAAVANWLVDQSVLISGVAPRPVKHYQIIMTQHQLAVARGILLLGLPGGVILVGALVWWRRRS